MERTSMPLFIEIKSEVDNLISLNDSSLSQQIEFILQDPILDKSPTTLLSSTTSTSEMIVANHLHHGHQQQQQFITTNGGVVGAAGGDPAHHHHHQLLMRQEQLDPMNEIKVEKFESDEVDDDMEAEQSPSSSSFSSSSSSFAHETTTAVAAVATTTTTAALIQHHHLSVPLQLQPLVAVAAAPTAVITAPPPPPTAASLNSSPATSSSSSSTSSVEYQCIECPEKFDNKEIFEIHKSGHANNMKCAICNMVLKSLKNYEKHCLRCKPYECQICGRVVRFRPNFIKHMRVHTGQQSERHKYKCEVCHKEFMSFEYFKVHKKIHNDNVNLTCEICGKVFSALASLRGHSKLHSGVKLHKCDVCGKGFGQRYNLKIHARTHTGDFPFECKVCKKKMHTQSSLQTHMQTHQKDQTSQATAVSTIIRTPVQSISARPKLSDRRIIKHEIEDDDAQMFESQPTTAEESSNESNDNNVIKNDVQNGPQGLSTIYAQKHIIKSQTKQSDQQQHTDDHHRMATNAAVTHHHHSPSLATAALIKCEPNLYSSSDNSVEMLIKKESIFDDCSAPHHNSPPTSKFHSNFDSDLVDPTDLHHSLSYSNLFEPNSMPDSIPDELYPDDDDFRLDTTSLGLHHTHSSAASAIHSTDGDYIKKEWVYSSNSTYSISVHDELPDAANFIYD